MDKDKHNNKDNELFDQVDYYLSRSRALINLYLAEHGVTQEMLLSMPGEQASLLYREACDFASAQMARTDAMLRLGQHDTDAKPDVAPKRRHMDRLAHRFQMPPK